MSSTGHLTNECPTRGRKRETTKASHCDSHSPFTCRESKHFLPVGLTRLLCKRTEHQPPFLPPLPFVHAFLSHVASTSAQGAAHLSRVPHPTIEPRGSRTGCLLSHPSPLQKTTLPVQGRPQDCTPVPCRWQRSRVPPAFLSPRLPGFCPPLSPLNPTSRPREGGLCRSWKERWCRA